jgi:hypothetical protein
MSESYSMSQLPASVRAGVKGQAPMHALGAGNAAPYPSAIVTGASLGESHGLTTNDQCIVVHSADGVVSVMRVADNLVLHPSAVDHADTQEVKASLACEQEKLATAAPEKVTSLGHVLFSVKTYVEIEFTLAELSDRACSNTPDCTVATARLFSDLMRPKVGDLTPDAKNPHQVVDTKCATLVEAIVFDYSTTCPLEMGMNIPGVERTQHKAGRCYSVILSQTSAQIDGESPLSVHPADPGDGTHSRLACLDPKVLVGLSLSRRLPNGNDAFLVHPFLALYFNDLANTPASQSDVALLWALGAQWQSRPDLQLQGSKKFIVAVGKHLEATKGKMQLLNMKTATVSFQPATKCGWKDAVQQVAHRFGCADSDSSVLASHNYYVSVGLELTYMIPSLDADLCAVRIAP